MNHREVDITQTALCLGVFFNKHPFYLTCMEVSLCGMLKSTNAKKILNIFRIGSP